MKKIKFTINGQTYETVISEFSPTHARVNVNGHEYYVEIQDESVPEVPKLERTEKAMPVAPVLSSSFDTRSGEIRSPLPGVIFSIPVSEGDKVRKGDPVIVLEAMKMQSEIAAPIDGTITKIHKKEKALVHEGDILITIMNEQIAAEKQQEKPVRGRRLSDRL
jgi:biotin carboxyl carrier protein